MENTGFNNFMGEVKKYDAGEFDVIVIGAGHAGCEAALACARMGMSTMMMTMTLDSIAMMACNPSIGGTGKGHLVREIDALGGQMGINIDKTMIQCKMLNISKGPAVHSLRAQADKNRYHAEMKKTVENQDNLYLLQAEATDIEVLDEENFNIHTKYGAYYKAKAIIVTTGTYLKSKVFIGELNYESGPNGLFPATDLSQSLLKLGLKLRRFKTGTPARISSKTLNFESMELHGGDKVITPFSFMTNKIEIDQIPCYLTYTTAETKEIIMNNLDRSPLYSGVIESVGPRYCPSIEDKVVKFSDKEKHQIFVEPEGLDTNEMYIQGMSSSLPYEVQEKMYKSMVGLENSQIMRPAYAIEYDCIDPTQLKSSLEYKNVKNLFFAGQINGSSGYEEAGAQGIIAGINAVLSLRKEEPLILDRSEAYAGVLIDDLVTKGTEEPYRMMTSRAEYRLVLRQDNADERLTEKGYAVGLVTEERYSKFKAKKDAVDAELNRLSETKLTPKTEVNEFLENLGSVALSKPISIAELIKRPEITYRNIEGLDVNREKLSEDIISYIETCIKYEGYIQKQIKQIEQFKKLEDKKIPENIEYNNIKGLRIEAIQKMSEILPKSIGQASRISGVSPADISVLLIYLEQVKREKNS